MGTEFDYDTAFSRNIGWVTSAEQAILRAKRVAIAGMGGVGGYHLLALSRLGIGAMHIADYDTFDMVNFNRQAGATLSNLGRPKVEAMAEQARDINPSMDIRLFAGKVDESNVHEFLNGVDLYVDGIDFFASAAREAVFRTCAERGIPAITAAPLGMSAAMVAFLPGRMTFEEYFRLNGLTDAEKAIQFLIGFAPGMLHRHYLMDRSRVNLAERTGPSTVMGCYLCAGVVATQALKILLKRGKVYSAPYAIQFDAYRNKLVRTWRPGGNRNWMNRLAVAIAKRQLGI